MNRKNLIALVAILIILAVVGYVVCVYLGLGKPSKTEVKKATLKPVSLKIMTDWSQWGQDDFKRYFFAESGMPRAGVMTASASMLLNITNISFVRVLNPKEWVEAGRKGEVDGFIGQNRYNISYVCLSGGLHPIEDAIILELVKHIPDIMKGYTEDGKLCWVAMYWQPYAWLINREYAEKNGLAIPESWSDLIKPEYLGSVLKGVSLVAIYPVANRPATSNTVNVLLSKYGWEKGWSLIAVVFGGASSLYTSSSAARTAISTGKALLTILGFEDAYTAYSMDPDRLSIKFPKNETGVWLTPIAIAAGVSEDGLDGMYRLITWTLTDMQDKMLLNRSGWLNMPVLGWNNTSPRMVYKEQAMANIHAPPLELELALGEAGPSITLYADIITTDGDVRGLLRQFIQKLAEKYIKGEIDVNTYYKYIFKLGEPVEFTDPVSKTQVHFTLEKARELGNAMREGKVSVDELKQELKNALVNKLNSLIESLS